MSEPVWGNPVGPGDEVGGFVIEAIAGRGGMGVVYRAHQKKPDRVVAVKVIAPDLAADPEFRARFERESAIAAQIEHPNVIPVYVVGEDRGVLFIAMRFVAGIDLRTVIAHEGRLEPPRAALIVDQVGQALDAAHEHGLVHRDVKPGNILLSRAGGRDHVYLTDFGLSRHVEASHAVTGTGAFLGTIDYAAPEQVRGERVDARTDVYSLGCVLFQVLSGTVPFPRDNDAAKLYAHVAQPPPSVCERAPGVPEAFDSVVSRALAKSPEDRYSYAGDLGRAAVAAGTTAAEPHVTHPAGAASAASRQMFGRRVRRDTQQPLVERPTQPESSPPSLGGDLVVGDTDPQSVEEASSSGEPGDHHRRLRPPPKSSRRRRSILWLTTLSTVVAVATGMFTLRNQIFPQESGSAQGSVTLFQQSVGDICRALNHAEIARATGARQFARRLARASDTLTQRNVVLDNWNQLVASQDYELARFEALDVPSAVMSRGRDTAAAWDRITRRLRRFVQRLEGTTNRRDLIAAVATLPAIRSDIAADQVTRAAGLIRLGGRRCTLNAPIVTPTITLPGTSESVSTKSSELPFTATLPATGLNAWWLLLTGAIMTVAGTILRRLGLRPAEPGSAHECSLRSTTPGGGGAL